MKIKSFFLKIFNFWPVLYFSCLLLIGEIVLNIVSSSQGSNIGLSLVFAVFTAVVISSFIYILKRTKWIAKTILVIFSIVINLLFFIDGFMVAGFGKRYDDEAYLALINTNPTEASEFLSIYINWLVVIVVILALLVFNVVLIQFCKYISQRYEKFVTISIMGLLTAGCIYLGYSTIRVLATNTGYHLNESSIFARFIHPVFFSHKGYLQTERIYEVGEGLKGNVQSNPSDSTIYVIVIGESHNCHHSQLYGYHLPTEPLLYDRSQTGELVVFDDCNCMFDATWLAMKSIFSFAKGVSDLEEYPIIPQVFKNAGYTVNLYDNQFLKGSTRWFVEDPYISDQVYSFRNDKIYTYDGEMIETITFNDIRSLNIIHLNGQHYIYAKRMPDSFRRRFDITDYPSYPENHRDILANYDNTLCYTDSIVDAIITKLEGENACLFYFSDHGEEIYDYGEYIGHGNSASRENKDFQLKVPFYVWGSESFRKTATWSKILNARHRGISTDDFSYTIVDIAGIDFPQFDSSRSFVSDTYKER